MLFGFFGAFYFLSCFLFFFCLTFFSWFFLMKFLMSKFFVQFYVFYLCFWIVFLLKVFFSPILCLRCDFITTFAFICCKLCLLRFLLFFFFDFLFISHHSCLFFACSVCCIHTVVEISCKNKIWKLYASLAFGQKIDCQNWQNATTTDVSTKNLAHTAIDCQFLFFSAFFFLKVFCFVKLSLSCVNIVTVQILLFTY